MTARIGLILAAGISLAGCASPLLRSARDGDAAAVSALLAQGVDPDVRGGGETPLLAAAGRGSLPVVQALVEKGAKVNVSGDRGETPLMRAANRGRLEILKYLVAHGADVRAKTALGTTALHYAAASGDLESVRFLVEHGAPIDAADTMFAGRTPLGIAAYFGDAELTGFLLEKGADPRVPGNNGRPPAKQARWQGHFALSKMIEKAEQGKSFGFAAAAAAGPEVTSDVDTPGYQLHEDSSAFAVVVGAGSYLSLPQAEFAERDAKAVREHLRALGYRDDHVLWLSGVQATRAGLAKALGRLSGMVDDRSMVLFYFAGRGAADSKTRQAFLLPIDGDPDYLADTGYPVQRLYEQLSGLRAAHAIAILDCGFSGRGERSALAAGAAPADHTDAQTLGPGKVAALLDAPTGPQAELPSGQGHGRLSYFLLRGLNEAAKNAEGSITVGYLYDYFRANAQTPLLLPDAASPTLGLRLR